MIDVLLAALWQGTLAAAVALTASRALRRRAPVLREVVLTIAVLKLTLPPLPLPVVSVLTLAGRRAGFEPGAADGLSIGWLLAAAVVYVTGVLVAAARLGWSFGRLRQLVETSTPAPGNLAAMARRLGVDLQIRRPIAILVSDGVAAPLAAGILRPVVILPAALLDTLAPQELRAVLVHELTHHRRGHLAIAWLRAAAVAVWWWNPLAHALSRGLRRAQEDCCDTAAMQAAGLDAPAYCDVLLRCARSVAAPPALTAGMGAHPLGDRVRRLLSGPLPSTSLPAICAAACLAAFVMLPGGHVQRAPQRQVIVVEQTPTPTWQWRSVVRLEQRASSRIDRLASRVSAFLATVSPNKE